MIRVGVVGVGKMGLSHLAIINALEGASVTAVCDPAGYLLDVINKYTGLNVYPDYTEMLASAELDAVIIATPSAFHVDMVRAALERGLHVFCEKPFTLNWNDAEQLAALAQERNLVNQVGYHYRFVGAFQETKRLLDANALGKVSHVLAEAYGPVVLKPKGSTWRTKRTQGGGCLYDYAAHPLNLLNWYFGQAEGASGTALNKIFSRDTDDEVLSTLTFQDDVISQISVNWSDESYRKMSTKITIWGTNGRLYADRQEVQIYLRKPVPELADYAAGWNVRYTTDLTEPVSFYIRGEEYSGQLEYFIAAIQNNDGNNVNSFKSAAETDKAIAMMIDDFENDERPRAPVAAASTKKRFSLFNR